MIGKSLISQLQSIYGQDTSLINERLNTFLKVTKKFKKIFGEKEVSLIRVPGRLNMLGMHIDHRGGFINTIAINREMILCYARRDDDLIDIHNLDPFYGERKFNVSKELPSEKINSIKAWLNWAQKQTDKRRQTGIDQDWINKLKSIPIYLQVFYPDKKLLGFEAILDSNIPVGMGLSSSSAIVVGVLEVMMDINQLSLTKDGFVNLCGVSEWFVGTRGGSGDHAAIKFSRLGMITHMQTLPKLRIKSYLPFPDKYKIVIFTSGTIADKSGEARQKFNEKTATYEIGEIYIREYIKRHHPGIFQRITSSRDYLSKDEKKFYLADVVECLNQSQIYALLQSLPHRMSREELLSQFPRHKDFLKVQFATHLEPQNGYEVGSVILYGISECKRSRMLEGVLKNGQIDVFGKLMNISHEGDRVAFKDMETKKLVIDIKRDLYLHSGGYDCSTPQIDEMVDLSRDAGAVGAQISGAGLGGSVMVLVKDKELDHLIKTLRTEYYIPRKIKEEFIILYPVQGACQLKIGKI